jgi:hypothetical protein
MIKTALAAVVVGLCALPLQAQEVKNYALEATAATTAGIATYEIAKTERPGRAEYEVTLLGSANELRGSATVKELPGGVESVTVREPNRPALTVIWDKAKGTLMVAQGRRRGQAKVVEGQWVEDAVMKRFKSTRLSTIELAGAILVDVVTAPRHKDRKPISEIGTCEPGAEVATSASAATFDTLSNPRCTGYECHGSSFGHEYYCCGGAIEQANICCWNKWCIGCPCRSECTAHCLIPLFFCHCEVRGIACGAPPLPPECPPPPTPCPPTIASP